MQTATLKWKSKNAERVEIHNQIGQVGLEGEKQVMPDRSTVYCITAYGETSEVKKVVRLNVYQTPTIKSLERTCAYQNRIGNRSIPILLPHRYQQK